MNNQVKTIDYDQIWITCKKDPCYRYKVYQKINKKYITPITEDIKNISKGLKREGKFKTTPYENRLKIYGILEYIDKLFNIESLEELMEKELSLLEFIDKAYEIRNRNFKKYS